MEIFAGILIGLVGWGLFLIERARRARTLQMLTAAVGGGEARLSLNELHQRLNLLCVVEPNGLSLNSLLAVLHRDLCASGVEISSNPELSGDNAGSTAVRVTSGKSVTSTAHCIKLSIGDLRLGDLRIEAPPFTPAQERLLGRIAAAIVLQLIAQRTAREVRQIAGVQGESDKARTGFIASLSHELRGPLGMVLNAVELVRDELCGPINSDQRETLGLVHGNVKHLLNLVNDVLDFAKTENGNAVPQRSVFEVGPVLNELVASARGQAEAKHQRLTIKGDIEVYGDFDARHFRQIVLNLLTNAVKYTPDGGEITVEVKEQRDRLLLNVIDTGVGIPQQEAEKVFVPFERVSTGLQEKGTGLGMPLSKLLAEKNGGVLSFSSRVGVGSTFTLAFPLGERPSVEAGDGVNLKAVTSLSGQSIVLASRDQDQLRVLSRALGALDAAVQAPSELEWENLDGVAPPSSPVTAVIIDSTVVSASKMPEQEIASWVAFANKRRVPLVMLTPRAFEFDTAQYIKSGVDICVAKPFQATDLAQTLNRLKVAAP